MPDAFGNALGNSIVAAMKQARIDKALSQLNADAANDCAVLRANGVGEADALAAVFTSVPDLKRKLMRYIRHYNQQPKPVKWKYFDPSRRISSESVVTVH